MLEFDKKGYLKPYRIIETDLQTFQQFFVENFELSETRLAIFSNFFDFIQDFKKLICPNFTTWLNGSFVSNKLNPNDLDMVVFIDYNIYESKIDLIENNFSNLRTTKKYTFLDVYTIRVYPETHFFYFFYQMDKVYWNDWFSKTRLNDQRKQNNKGFIQLNF